MRLIRYSFIVLLCIASLHGKGQCKAEPLSSVEILPVFLNGTQDEMKFSRDSILPIISTHQFDNTFDLPTRLRCTLIIDENGKVCSAKVISPVPDELRKKIEACFLRMKGWKAATKNNQPVCTERAWIISCIKWN